MRCLRLATTMLASALLATLLACDRPEELNPKKRDLPKPQSEAVHRTELAARAHPRTAAVINR